MNINEMKRQWFTIKAESFRSFYLRVSSEGKVSVMLSLVGLGVWIVSAVISRRTNTSELKTFAAQTNREVRGLFPPRLKSSKSDHTEQRRAVVLCLTIKSQLRASSRLCICVYALNPVSLHFCKVRASHPLSTYHNSRKTLSLINSPALTSLIKEL